MNSNLATQRVMLGTLLLALFCPLGSLQASPAQTVASKIRADALLKQGRTEAAIGLYEKVLKKDRDFANAYYNLATAYYLQGKAGKALENLETFVRLRPRDSEALYNLGCLKLWAGAFEEAEKNFRSAWDCSSSPLLCQKIKEALQFLKDLRQENPETQKLVTAFLSF